MNSRHERRTRRGLGLLALALAISGCQAPGPAPTSAPLPTQRPPGTAVVNVFITGPPTATVPPIFIMENGEGLQNTLAEYQLAEVSDRDGAKADAFATLRDFVDSNSTYRHAWWFADDGQADIFEALAVILFTEGNTNVDVLKAVAARYIWYCGGTGTRCQGHQLINFLAYFQPWRQPWATNGGFVRPEARKFLGLAKDIVLQRPGLLTDWIPGADTYVHDATGLYGSSVYWDNAPFHFANVHPTWDAHLRQKLGRAPNGPFRLWVLTIREAGYVCQTRFVCENMTHPRSGEAGR